MWDAPTKEGKMERTAPIIWYGLLAVHAGLGIWAVLGMIEFLTPRGFGFGLANRNFPNWMQLLHWLAIASGALAFLLTWRRWPQARMPAMVTAYGFMAGVCLLQTLLFLQHHGKWRDMALEYAAYLSILWMLARLPCPPDKRIA